MAKKQCVVNKKSSVVGYNVSHSKRRTHRRVYANLQNKRLFNPATNSFVRVDISAQGLRTLAKWEKQGKKYDLKKLVK
jgi:large subunit ribosomal protein L28